MPKNSCAQIDPKVAEETVASDALGGQVEDNSSYLTRSKEPAAPVQGDNAPAGDSIRESKADSEAQLKRDENEAIDESKVVKSRTRQAKPRSGTYKE